MGLKDKAKGLKNKAKKTIPEDFEEKAREAGESAKAAAADVGEHASTAADATADVVDRGDQSVHEARSEAQDRTDAVKQAGRDALDATGGRAATRDESDTDD
jgi:hypothetical protein